jgi:hypothetical protein
MFLVADVKCYYCGFISGELVSPMGQSLKNGTFRPAAGVDAASSVHEGKLRCARCGGPVYTDEIRTERPKPAVTFFERERPGRPRRIRPEGTPAAHGKARRPTSASSR